MLGPFDPDDAPADAVMFGCRVGRVASRRAPAASLVQAGSRLPTNARWGPRLDRPGALEHRRLDDFWSVVDWLIVNDRVLHEHVFHLPEGPTDVQRA